MKLPLILSICAVMLFGFSSEHNSKPSDSYYYKATYQTWSSSDNDTLVMQVDLWSEKAEHLPEGSKFRMRLDNCPIYFEDNSHKPGVVWDIRSYGDSSYIHSSEMDSVFLSTRGNSLGNSFMNYFLAPPLHAQTGWYIPDTNSIISNGKTSTGYFWESKVEENDELYSIRIEMDNDSLPLTILISNAVGAYYGYELITFKDISFDSQFVKNGLYSDLPNLPIVNKDLIEEKEKVAVPIIGKGDYIPDLGLINMKGEESATPLGEDKLVLLDFWHLSCGPCIKAIPAIDALIKDNYSEKQLAYLTINVHDSRNKDKVQDWAAKIGLNLDQIAFADHDFLRTELGINFAPYLLFIRNGEVVDVRRGWQEGGEKVIKEQIDRLLKN